MDFTGRTVRPCVGRAASGRANATETRTAAAGAGGPVSCNGATSPPNPRVNDHEFRSGWYSVIAL